MENTRLSILLVDDDINEREGVRFLIERAKLPLRILEAPNGMRALELIRQENVDILFTDVKMPYMDGLELSAIVHDEFPQIKIIIFSAYGEFEYAKKAMAAKAINYLLKPIDIGEFHSVMDLVIQRCQEDQLQAKQRLRRIQADRKLQWINILTGKTEVNKVLLTELQEQNYPVENGLTLIHMETQGDFFAIAEKQVLSTISGTLSCKYEYINVYPNSSFLLAFEELPREKISSLCEALDACAETQGEISFLVDDLYFKLEDLSRRVSKINDVSRQMFLQDSGTVFMSDLAELMQGGVSEVEEVWVQTSSAILSRNKTIILSHVSDLLDAMTSHGLFSKTYIYYIFCDLYGKLYTEFRFSDTQRIQAVFHQIGGCRSKHTLLLLTSAVLDEVGHKKDSTQDIYYIVQKVKRIIHKEYSNDIGLDYLAEQVGLAPSYLSYVFKRETGENLIKYLTDYRMQEAKRLLDDGKYKIIQVAKLCGYENQSYFNRLFKNTYGMTPKQYREKTNED